MPMDNRLTVVVNSTDSFEDCWQPFFRLFSRYWGDCPYPIVLNTETKDFRCAGLPVVASKVQRDSDESNRPPWSDCLMRCLDDLSTEYVLYLQDDYFLEAPVQTDRLASYLELMREHSIDHIQLMATDAKACGEPWPEALGLRRLRHDASYPVSTQAGLWRREVLRAYLRSGETGWRFERHAALRFFERHDRFLLSPQLPTRTVDTAVIPYMPTGIIKGQWHMRIVQPLFARHDIEMDFSARGEYWIDEREARRVALRSQIRRLVMCLLARSRLARNAYNLLWPFR